MNECNEWLKEVREVVFPKLNRKKIFVEYRKISSKTLGYLKAKVPQKFDFDPEALLLGKSKEVKKRRLKPKEFKIFVNQKLQEIKNSALRKEIVQNIIIHELLHVEYEDLITLSKHFGRRKKKKIHVKDFEEEVFKRFNELRKIKGIMQIEKKEHLNTAINRILDSINFRK